MVKNWMKPKKYYAQLPKKRIASGMLILNSENEVLLVKPSYKKCWCLPGGSINADESPLEAAKRETREEIGLDIKNPIFLGVQYVKNTSFRGESLQFFFGVKRLEEKEIKKIKVDGDEIVNFGFFDLDRKTEKIGDDKLKNLKKLKKALEEDQIIYWEGKLTWEEDKK